MCAMLLSLESFRNLLEEVLSCPDGCLHALAQEKEEIVSMGFLCWISDQESTASGEEKKVPLCTKHTHI